MRTKTSYAVVHHCSKAVESLVGSLQAHPALECAGSARSELRAHQLLRAQAIDVLIVGDWVTEGSSVALIRHVQAAFPGVALIVLYDDSIGLLEQVYRKLGVRHAFNRAHGMEPVTAAVAAIAAAKPSGAGVYRAIPNGV